MLISITRSTIKHLQVQRNEAVTLHMHRSSLVTLAVNTQFKGIQTDIKILDNDGTPIMDDSGQFILAE